ncbi:MAG: sugar ABC transporter permease [Chloroflexi bacterium]|nr:sugar ABC transporter permease [Chloroflexota bacterium]
MLKDNARAEAAPARVRRAEGGLSGFFRELDKPKKLAILFIIPLELFMILLVVFPLFFELYLSFTNWQANFGNWWSAKWIWFGNYGKILTEMRFIMAVVRTLAIVVAALVLEGFIGLGLALLFVDNFPGKKVLTSIILTPMMIIPLVTGFIFYMMFLQSGPINGFIGLIRGGIVTIPWLQQANLAIPAIIAADVYQWTPLMFMIFVAGLVAIPENINSAAFVLGASAWQRFRYISLPMLKPVIVIALIIRGVEAIKIFDVVYLMTRGGPGNQTETISTYLYEVGFQYFRLSYTAAAAFIILIFISLVAMQAVKPLKIVEER